MGTPSQLAQSRPPPGVQKAGYLNIIFKGAALVATAGHHELVAHRRGCAPPEGSAGSDHRGPEAKPGERLQ